MRGKRGQQKVAPTALERERSHLLARVERDARIVRAERNPEWQTKTSAHSSKSRSTT